MSKAFLNNFTKTKRGRQGLVGKSTSAFTLIELLVVIAIISLLSSVVLASLSSARERAKVTRTVSDLKQIETGMTLWLQSTGQASWPTEGELGLGGNPSIQELIDNTTLDQYLNSAPEPPFGSYADYMYDNDGDTITSCASYDFDGPQIQIYDVADQSIAEAVDEIVDGSVDLDCGKLLYELAGTSKYRIIYSLSFDQSF